MATEANIPIAVPLFHSIPRELKLAYQEQVNHSTVKTVTMYKFRGRMVLLVPFWPTYLSVLCLTFSREKSANNPCNKFVSYVVYFNIQMPCIKELSHLFLDLFRGVIWKSLFVAVMVISYAVFKSFVSRSFTTKKPDQ